MNRRRLTALCIVIATVIVALLVSSQTMLVSVRAQDEPDPTPPPYTPYPPGILPANLNSEIARVLREVDNIEAEALGELRALPPPTLTNQPPLLAGTGQRLNVLVGK